MKSCATGWGRLEVRQMLADRDTGPEKLGMGRSRRIAGVVDVERVDAHESRSLRDQKFRGSPRQERVVGEIRRSTPMFREIGPKHDRAAGQIEVAEGVAIDGAPGPGCVDDDGRQIGELLQGKAGEVYPIAIPVPRRIDIGSGIAAEMEAGDIELGLVLIPLV